MIKSRNAHTTTSSFRLTCFLIVIIAILVGVQVYLTNLIATSGKFLSELEKKEVALEEENRKLLSENVDHMSLHELSQKAKVMGYIEPEEVVNFSQNGRNLALQNLSSQ